MITAYLGRDNVIQFSLQELQKSEVPVTPNTVTRVVVTLIPKNGKTQFCLDTDDPSGILTLTEADTAVNAQFGLVPNLIVGDFEVYFTVYDGGNPNGLAWGAQPDRQHKYMTEPSFLLRVVRWPLCA